LARPTESISILVLLLVSLSVGCSDDDEDPPDYVVIDSAVGAAVDSAVRDSSVSDASPASDAAQSDAGAADSAAPMDSGGPVQDSGQNMDATSPDAASSDAGDAASQDGAVQDGAAGDGSADAAQDATADGSTDAGNWPVPGCDESYRFVARTSSGGRYQVAGGSNFATFTFDAPWNNQQVQAIAFRLVLDNGQVVKRVRLENAGTGDVLTHFAAGDDDRTLLPSNVGMSLPTGMRSLRLAVRYVNTTGGNRSDASGVDVCVVRQTRLRSTLAAVTKSFLTVPPVIPANATNMTVTSVCNVNNVQPVYLASAGPYAHEYGVWAKFTVTKENGTEIDMHHQAYDFDARSVFPFTDEVMIEQGDRVTTTCVFTNPTDDDLPAASGGETLEGLCANLALYYPAGVLTCTPPP